MFNLFCNLWVIGRILIVVNVGLNIWPSGHTGHTISVSRIKRSPLVELVTRPCDIIFKISGKLTSSKYNNDSYNAIVSMCFLHKTSFL